MSNTHKFFGRLLFALMAAVSIASAQDSVVTKTQPTKANPSLPATITPAVTHSSDLAPMTLVQSSAPAAAAPVAAPSPMNVVAAAAVSAPTPAPATSPAQGAVPSTNPEIENGGVG